MSVRISTSVGRVAFPLVSVLTDGGLHAVSLRRITVVRRDQHLMHLLRCLEALQTMTQLTLSGTTQPTNAASSAE
jgi:hypothetical protein